MPTYLTGCTHFLSPRTVLYLWSIPECLAINATWPRWAYTDCLWLTWWNLHQTASTESEHLKDVLQTWRKPSPWWGDTLVFEVLSARYGCPHTITSYNDSAIMVAETKGERASHIGRNLTFGRIYVWSLDSKWRTWKLAVAGTSNRTWQFSPDKSLKRKKEKVVAAQPIEFELSFSPLTSMYDFYSFWMFEFGWRAKTISGRKVWWSRCSEGIAIILSRLLYRILTIMYMRINFNNPVQWVLYYRCESVRNVKAQLADPAVS